MSVVIDFTNNDSDLEDGTINPDTIDLDPTSPGQQTTLTVPGQGTFNYDPATNILTFTPEPGFVGTVSISYTITDSNGVVSSPATITVTITTPATIGNTVSTASVVSSLTPTSSDVQPQNEQVCSVGCQQWQVYHTNRDGNWEIYRMGSIPGQPNALENLTQNKASDVAPSQSPDGQWITFASDRDGNWEIYVTPTNGDTSKTQRVTYNSIAIDTDPVWGPTNFVVYESTRDGNWELYMMNMATGEETRLTDNAADDLNAFWSPDGKKIVFQSNRSGKWQLYELNLTNAAVTRLSDGQRNDLDPAYSPNGQQIAYRSYGEDGKSVIYTMDADGSNRKPISDKQGNASNATWSPDGQLIAYQSDLDGDLDVYVYQTGTGKTRKLTNNTIADYAPSWLCGTTQLLFTSDINGNPDIYRAESLSSNPAGIAVDKEAEQLTTDKADDIYPLGAPSEENASQEGRLPAKLDAVQGETSFLKPDVSITVPDATLPRAKVWEEILGCTDEVLKQLTYQLQKFPVQ